METYPVVWGLDIGYSSIKAAKLSRNGNTVTVLGYAIEPIVVSEEGNRDEAVVNALQQLVMHEEFGGVPVVASLSGRQIFTRTINVPVLNSKKIDKMVELEARQQIPGNFDEVEWGYHLSPAADGASNDVALFAARRELTGEMIRKCKSAGINLVGVSVSSLALYNFVRFDQEFPVDETVIILDVGAENTDLVLYQGETLWMRTLALSGNDITKVFMKKFRVSFEEAETLKRQIGDSRQAAKILKVLESSLNELTSEVQRSLGFYKSQNPNAKLENIIISGNTFRLPNLPEYLAERLRYTVNILEDLDKIQVASGIDRQHFLHDMQSLGVAMGLALQGTGMTKANVNLLPSTLQMQRVLRTKRWAAVALVVLVGLTFTVNYSVLHRLVRDNGQMTANIKSKYLDNETRIRASKAMLQQVAPKANTLKEFNCYGTQKGVVHAVMESVIGVVEDFIREKGQVNPDAPPPETGKEAPLQAVYLDNVTVESFPFTDESGPFRPLAKPRMVTIKLRIPVLPDNSLKGLSLQAVDRLKGLPVPPYLTGIHQGATLFTDVKATTDVPGDDLYHNVDRTKVDERTGQIKKIEEERKSQVRIVTFACTMDGRAANAPPVEPAPKAKDNSKGKEKAKPTAKPAAKPAAKPESKEDDQ